MPLDIQQPSHPFGQILAADEPLLWVARPNPDVFRAGTAKVYLFCFGFSAAVLFVGAVLLAGYVYAVFALFFVLVGVVVVNQTVTTDEEWSITWYALTPRRLLKQSLDTEAENGRCTMQVALTDLRRVRLRKKHIGLGISVGTITCYTPALFVREHLTLDCIENPNEVFKLIENTRAKMMAL